MFCYSKPARLPAVSRRRSFDALDTRPTRCRNRHRFALATLLSLYAAISAAQDDAGGSEPVVQGSLSLTSEHVVNLGGGIARGDADDHLLEAGLAIEGRGIGLPAGSKLQGSFIHTWDARPSTDLVGDAQGFSNIAASPHSALYTLWYSQPLAGGRGAVDLGLVPADHFFDVADSGGLLINSSFGVQPTWSANTAAPIYPTSGLGAIVTWKAGKWRNRTGVFQADPRDRSTAFDRGFLLLDEVDFAASDVVTYKLGIWGYRPHDPPASPLPANTWGGYAIAEHALAAGADAPTAFVRVGWSPPPASSVPFDFQVGVLLPAPFKSRPDDQFSLGVAGARLRGQGMETAYEATYLLALAKQVSLQPDLQYVVHPGGNLPAATVATIRLHLDL